MKKIFIVLLALSLALSMFVSCGKKDDDSDKLTHDQDGPGEDSATVIITEQFKFDYSTNSILGFNDTTVGVTDITIPSEIEGHAVTKIAANAFNGKQLTSVVLPDSIVEIGGNSFKDNKLTEIKLPDSLTKLDYNAFLKNLLTEITIPEGITELAMGVFRDNLLTTINWSGNVTLIGRSAFENNKLKELVLPDSIRILGSSSFSKNEIETLVLNEGLERIDGHAFENNKLSSLTIPASVTLIGMATEGSEPPKNYEKYVFAYNELTEIIVLGEGTEIMACMLGEHNHLRDAFNVDGPGTYTGTQNGEWTKTD